MAKRNARTSSHTAVVVLGLLAQQPRHGYEILQIIKDIHLTDWAKVGTATVYAALVTLEREGAVVSTTTRDGLRPARHVYSITEKGRSRVRDNVRALLMSAAPVHSDRLVGAAFSWVLANHGAVASLTTCRNAIEGRLAELRAVQEASTKGSHVTKLVLNYLIGVAEAERSSLEISLTREQGRVTPPGRPKLKARRTVKKR